MCNHLRWDPRQQISFTPGGIVHDPFLSFHANLLRAVQVLRASSRPTTSPLVLRPASHLMPTKDKLQRISMRFQLLGGRVINKPNQ